MDISTRVEFIIQEKNQFDRTYEDFHKRRGNTWRYKYEIDKDKKCIRTDTNAATITRVALDAYCSFLLSQGLDSIHVEHKNDPLANQKFLSLAKKHDLLSALREIVYHIINFDSHLIHIHVDKSESNVIFEVIPPNRYTFILLDKKVTPLVYNTDYSYYPVDDFYEIFKNLKNNVHVIDRDLKTTIGLVEKDTIFSWSKNAHYGINMMGCRAFASMGIEDEIIEYKTALDTLMSFNAYPTMLVDSNAMINAPSLKPGQMMEYTPSQTTPGLAPLRRAIPDVVNMATENIEYIKYLKTQLQEIYMLDVVLKDDATASTTALAGISEEIYAAITGLVEKFLHVLVGFGEFREFNQGSVDNLTISFRSHATHGTNALKYANMVQTIDVLTKLGQAEPELLKKLDIAKLIKETTTILGTSDAIAFLQD